MAVDHDRIAQLLGEDGERSDTSLRAKALKRATDPSVPHTLTPYEWEQWYEEFGVPENHRKREQELEKVWWRRLMAWWIRVISARDIHRKERAVYEQGQEG